MKLLYTILCAWLAMLSLSLAAEYERSVRPVLEKYCMDCHGEQKQKARIRFDRITDYQADDQHLWAKVHEALVDGEMPPEDESLPSAMERKRLVDWIRDRAKDASAANAGLQRRLNRREFSAALQDVTGVPIDFGAGLPADGKVDGFDTGRQGLRDAADSVALWLDVTRRAVESIRFLEPDRDRRIRIDFREHAFTDFRKWVEQNYKDQGIFTRSKRLTCKKGLGVYLPTEWMGDRGNSFLAVPAPADKQAALKLTLRVFSRRPLPGLPVPTLAVKVGGAYIDYVPVGEDPQTLTYALRMEDSVIEGEVIKIMIRSYVEVPYAVEGFENDDRSKPEDKIPGGIGVYRPKWDRKVLREIEQQPVPAIVIESVEIDYDHRAAWPPAAWNADIGALADNDECAQRLLALWMDRAWRRPVAEPEQAKFFALYKRLRGEDFGFDAALRATFQSVLMGGPFRYLASPADAEPVVAQHAIASRLAFMLTGAPPGEPLRRLAAAGKLREPKVLDDQVDRLLADPRSEDFFRPFVTQWLNMDQPITLTMSHFKKQDFRFGRHLKASMKEETVQYIARLFADNRPAKELVSSDWTMMNDILSVHYGLDKLQGGVLQKVSLPPRTEDPRGGGVIGHAGIQSMLCWMGDNWVIYRGAWTLDHILDDPPPPPPLEVPELNPSDKENRGKPFRELLAQHQADPKCSTCHTKMDPLGFAFQNFDLSGRWRSVEHERYHRYELDGKIEWRGEGKSRPVDASGNLPRGEAFTSFGECKELLVEHYVDDIVRGLLKKLTLYGTGRKANVLDLLAIRGIMREQAENEYALRDLLKAVVRSPIMLEPAVTQQKGTTP
jgi:hypothetical protein